MALSRFSFSRESVGDPEVIQGDVDGCGRHVHLGDSGRRRAFRQGFYESVEQRLFALGMDQNGAVPFVSDPADKAQERRGALGAESEADPLDSARHDDPDRSSFRQPVPTVFAESTVVPHYGV